MDGRFQPPDPNRAKKTDQEYFDLVTKDTRMFETVIDVEFKVDINAKSLAVASLLRETYKFLPEKEPSCRLS